MKPYLYRNTEAYGQEIKLSSLMSYNYFIKYYNLSRCTESKIVYMRGLIGSLSKDTAEKCGITNLSTDATIEYSGYRLNQLYSILIGKKVEKYIKQLNEFYNELSRYFIDNHKFLK